MVFSAVPGSILLWTPNGTRGSNRLRIFGDNFKSPNSHQAVHSVSKDKRWAIRESAARIDYIFIVADQDSADFPARSMLNTIADKISQRAIQDTEAWGGWRAP